MTATLGTRVCTGTGLSLVPASARRAFRVARNSRGPLDPRPQEATRPASNPDAWKRWNRWDVPGHRTIYAADSAACSYHEILATFERQGSAGVAEDLSRFVDGVYDDGWDEVTEEWQSRGHMAPFFLPQSWRDDRRMYQLDLPADGWFIDFTAPESFASVGRRIGHELGLLGLSTVDLSTVTSMRRDVTCAIAEWTHGLVLDDGSFPHGIRYASRHGQGACWAVWLRELDDGLTLSAEKTKEAGSADIDLADPDLQRVCSLLGIRPF